MEQFAELPMQPSLAQCPYCITETQVWTLPLLVDMEIRYMFTKMENYNG